MGREISRGDHDVLIEDERGSLRLRRLTADPEDVSVMARWLSDPRVLEYYEGRDRPFDEERVREVFLEDETPGEVRCLVEERRPGQGRPTPVGYAQYYHLSSEELREGGYPPDEPVYGLDLFIGLPELWGTGLGTRVVAMLVKHLTGAMGAGTVIVDPIVSNGRALRSYEKAGFRRVKLLPAHEWHEGVWRDCWLMEYRSGKDSSPGSGKD